MKCSISKLRLLSAVFIFLCACKKSDSHDPSNGNYTATASFTIDGDNFHQQKISIQGVKKTTTYCNYSSTDKITTLNITDQSNINDATKNQFFLVFNGNAPATQHSGDDPNGGTFNSLYFQVTATDKEGVLHSYLFENANNTPGVFTITQFGKVGDIVSGSFSGTLVDEDGAPVIQISNGIFSITRDKDID